MVGSLSDFETSAHEFLVDRRKAERHLKKASKAYEAASNSSEKAELEQKLHIAQVDLNYTLYYPLARKYSALFPAKDDEHNESKTLPATKDEGMWLRVEQATEQGHDALQALRDESSFQPSKGDGSHKTPKSTKVLSSKQPGVDERGKVLEAQQEDEDDGFFDE